MGLKIAVIGAGNIGGALIGGILKSEVAGPGDVMAIDASDECRRRTADRWKVPVSAPGDPAAVRGRDVVILAVKPQILPDVLREHRTVLNRGPIILSVAAGVPIALIESVLGKDVPIFRAMPNIPVVVEEGATAVSGNNSTTAEQRKVVERIFAAVGAVAWVDESQLDAVTGLSGSGPAYVYMVIEALIDGGKKMGLSQDVATRLTEQTVLGAAKLVRETKLHPAVLRDAVVTPAGTTIAAIHELESHGLRAMLISAVETATARSKEIGSQIAQQLSPQNHQNPTVRKRKAKARRKSAN
jgi:pyrroline-5-carboxylate reductase